MTNDNDNDDETKKGLSEAEAAVIELMKRQNLDMVQRVPLGGGEAVRHAFWETQVRACCVGWLLVCLC